MNKLILRAAHVLLLTFLLVGAIKSLAAIDPNARIQFVRQFNKRVLNPFAIWLVEHRPMYYGVLHHTGRRSGKEYATPVVAKITTGGVIIPLPYGTRRIGART